jgi:hypothetical protein
MPMKKKIATDYLIFHAFRWLGLPVRFILVLAVAVPYFIFLLLMGTVLPGEMDTALEDYFDMFRWMWRPGYAYMYGDANKYKQEIR